MKIETERLILRPINHSDIDYIYKLRSNISVNKFIKRIPPKSLDDAKNFIDKILNLSIKNEMYFWGICFKETSEILGTVCLWKISEDRKNAELGYELFPEQQKKGIMYEAINSVLKFGFEIEKFERISAFTHKNNVASINLLMRFGFILSEGEIDKNNLDNLIFRIEK